MRALPAALLVTLVSLCACAPSDGGSDDPGLSKWVEDLPDPVELDWERIQERDTLRVLLVHNSTSYFLYRGEPMGYELDGLRSFAESHDLALDVSVVRDRSQLFRLLNEGEGDVVAARLVPVDPFREAVAFTRPLYRTRPVVVQEQAPFDSTPIPEPVQERLDSATKGEAPEPRGESAAEAGLQVPARLVRRPRQLAGDTVHLPHASEYYNRVVEISDTIEGTIELVELDSALTDETLIQRVAAGSVRFTVAHENLAELSEEYFTNIALIPTIGPQHPVAWAVRTNAPGLKKALDTWLRGEGSGRMDELYRTYFVDRARYRERADAEPLEGETRQLSDYDSLLAAHAVQIGWDWRLLASQAYQESRFDPRARSWAGATGLLQLMPATAREVGVADPWDPEENVAGAVRYLEWLEGQWLGEVTEPEQRLRFVLASYNAGRGHVMDAQRLAEANGDDPLSWDAVAYWLLQLSKRQHHTHPVVRYGYVRGLEPVTYVALILERFDHYREFVTGDPLGGRAVSAESAPAPSSPSR